MRLSVNESSAFSCAGRLPRLSVGAVAFFLLLVSLVAPAFAQVQTSGSGMSMGFTASIAQPEGMAPAYLIASKCWYDSITTDPDPTYTPSLNLESGVAYSWNGGPKRTVIETNGPMQYSSDKSGYLWSFDISGDAYRGFGANSTVFLQTRNNQYLTTGQHAPYLIGTSQITVTDSTGSPLSNADVRLINSTTGEYSEGMTNASGQLTFGQALYSTTDAPYAPGLTSDYYHVKVTSQNMADATSSDILGGSYANQNFTVKMASSASTVSPVSGSPGGTTGGTTGGSGSGSGTCSAQTVPFPASDGGGGAGISNWADPAFPATVQPAFLHSNSWTETVNVPVAGSYVITGDCPTASNIGTITLSVGGVAGTPVSCVSSSPGANLAASFGTFTLVAGNNTLAFTLAGQYGAVKTLYLTPGAACGSGSGTDTSSSFFSDFWAKLKQFFHDQFVPTADSLTALKSSLAALTSYGPFGLPGQISGLLGSLSTAVDSTSTQKDGTYWYWYLRAPQLGVFVHANNYNYGGPLGYDPTLEPVQPHTTTIYDSILPQYIDLTPFSDVILFTRRFMLLSGWLYFISEMLSVLIPKPGV